jgi:CRP-like cAMP-binding protein
MPDLDTIRSVEILQGLNDSELATVVRRAKRMEYKAGGVIVREKSPGGMLHIIIEGSVDVKKKSDDTERTLAALKVGEIFGEMSLFDDAPYSASVVARENTSTLSLYKNDFLDFAGQHPEVAFKVAVNIINTLAERLRKTSDNLVTFAVMARHS